MLIFLTVVGIFFTFRLRGLQFRRFFKAGGYTIKYRRGRGEGNMTPLQSLFSALGGIIGNGNLGGVATALAVGGPIMPPELHNILVIPIAKKPSEGTWTISAARLHSIARSVRSNSYKLHEVT